MAGAKQAELLLRQMGFDAFVSKLVGNHGGGLTHQATLLLSESEVSESILDSPSYDDGYKDVFIAGVKSIIDQWNRRKTQSGMDRNVQHPWDRLGA